MEGLEPRIPEACLNQGLRLSKLSASGHKAARKPRQKPKAILRSPLLMRRMTTAMLCRCLCRTALTTCRKYNDSLRASTKTIRGNTLSEVLTFAASRVAILCATAPRVHMHGSERTGSCCNPKCTPCTLCCAPASGPCGRLVSTLEQLIERGSFEFLAVSLAPSCCIAFLCPGNAPKATPKQLQLVLVHSAVGKRPVFEQDLVEGESLCSPVVPPTDSTSTSSVGKAEASNTLFDQSLSFTMNNMSRSCQSLAGL